MGKHFGEVGSVGLGPASMYEVRENVSNHGPKGHGVCIEGSADELIYIIYQGIKMKKLTLFVSALTLSSAFLAAADKPAAKISTIDSIQLFQRSKEGKELLGKIEREKENEITTASNGNKFHQSASD